MILSELDANWFIVIIVYMLISFIYYVAGWLVGLGFYRFGVLGGFGFIVIAFALVSLTDILWIFNTPKPIMGIFSLEIPSVHASIALLFTLVLAIVAVLFLRKLTRDVPIKVE